MQQVTMLSDSCRVWGSILSSDYCVWSRACSPHIWVLVGSPVLFPHTHYKNSQVWISVMPCSFPSTGSGSTPFISQPRNLAFTRGLCTFPRDAQPNSTQHLTDSESNQSQTFLAAHQQTWEILSFTSHLTASCAVADKLINSLANPPGRWKLPCAAQSHVVFA